MTKTTVVTVAQLAKQMKVNAKTLRRQLRSLPNVPYNKNDKRWSFTPANAKKVVAMLKAA